MLGGYGVRVGPGCEACQAQGCSCRKSCHGVHMCRACLQLSHLGRHCPAASGAACAQFPSAGMAMRRIHGGGPHMRQGCRQGGRDRVR